jgi:YVTN family beta-propeller protein
MHLWGIARTDKTLYVTHIQDASIAAIDIESHNIRTIETGGMPCALAINSPKAEIYVANYADGTVTILEKESPIATLKVATHPQALAIDTDKELLYVASPQVDLVTVIDLRSRRVIRSIKAGEHPYAIAIQPVTHAVYAANQSNVPLTQLRQP